MTFFFRVRALFLSAAMLAALPAAAADVWFNSDPDVDLTGQVLEAMERNVAEADGRPIEFRVNIFSFTEASIADRMLELAKNNPNLTISIATDWSQLSTSGRHQSPFLEEAARGNYGDACDGMGGSETVRATCVERLQEILGGAPLENVNVRYKKDDPYRWNAEAGRAVYHHSSTDGLNHHKGIAFVIDGVPTEMLTGSFNWSPTANDSNYENLMRFHRDVPAERELIRAYAAEQGAMFYNTSITLAGPDARAYRTWIHERHAWLNGAGPDPGPEPVPATEIDEQPIVVCPLPGVDPGLEDLAGAVNDAVAVTGGSFRDPPVNVNTAPLETLVSTLGVSDSVAREIRRERTNGGFEDAADLRARVPRAATLDEAAFAEAEFGSDRVAINHATEAELTGIFGVGEASARRIREWIETYGPVETLDDLRAAGLTAPVIARIAEQGDLRYSEAFFSSKHQDCDKAGTGFAAVNASNTTAVRNAGDDRVSVVPGALPAPAVDLFRRAGSGQTIRIAAYGFSPSSPEFDALKDAVERGVKVEVVLNKAYNGSIASALDSLADAHPGQVEAKWLSSRTMHEKFGVVGDDVFNGSANLNTSSTGKHSEDRFLVKNDPELSGAFHAEFDRLWERATWVVGQPNG